MRINLAGNVGIGTTAPSNKFVVAEGTNQHGIELVPGTLSYIQAYDRATSDYGDLKIDAQTIAFGTDNGAERMRIDSVGNVGINDTNPNTASLSIKGQSSVSANFPMLKLLGQSTSSDGLHITTTGNGNEYYAIKVATGGDSSAFNVTNAGNVGIGTSAPSSELDILGSSSRLRLDGSSASFQILSRNTVDSSTNAITFDADSYTFNRVGSTQAVIDSTGKVGIGVAAPRVQTEIQGAAQAGTANISDSGNSKGTLQVSDTTNGVNAGGTILFAAKNDLGTYTPQAAIKSLLQNGTSQGIGDLAFSTRNATSDTITERMRITPQWNLVQVRNSSIPTIQLYNTDTSLGIAGQTLGDIDFYQSDPSGGGVGVVSKIRSINDSSFQGEAGLSFHTGTTTGLAERMRIDSAGNVLVNYK